MSVADLKTLLIQFLRGSVAPFTLIFDPKKKLTIVYGENGTGKTTICDALEFLGKGEIGSLEKRGLGSKTDKYWPSLGKTFADVSVVLDTAAGPCTARIVKGKVVADPIAQRPHVEVLRRGQILNLLEAQPAQRYAEISRFIDISGVESAEESLKRQIDHMSNRRETAVTVVVTNQRTLEQFWETAGNPGTEWLTWAKAEVQKDMSAITETAGALSLLRAAYQRVGDQLGRYQRASQALGPAHANAQSAQVVLDAALQTASADAGELVGLLEGAQTYLGKHPNPAACPLCESEEKVQSLTVKVADRLAKFKVLRAAQQTHALAAQAVLRASDELKKLEAEIVRETQAFEALKLGTEWGAHISVPVTVAPKQPDALAAWLVETSLISESWAQFEGGYQEKSRFVATLSKALATYSENLLTEKELGQLLPRLQLAHQVIVEERQKFTDSVLGAIAKEVGRLYEQVHPGEGLEKIKLELDSAKRASLEIGASFAHQENIPPQAYFSQSHLDTLGLCIFLALAGMDNPQETILILDDVLASVDEPHVDRTVEMLYAEAGRFRHCLVTTHYRPWKQKLQWGWLKTGECHFIELTKWTPETGLQHRRSLPDVERLRTLLSELPLDSQLVCAKAGIILEAALNFLTELYECEVPRRASGMYTIGELLGSFDKKFKQSLKAEIRRSEPSEPGNEYQRISLGPIIDELARVAHARNLLGAHFSELSFQFLEGDATAFADQVLLLVDALMDSRGGWPRKEKQEGFWANADGSRRLYPIKRVTQ